MKSKREVELEVEDAYGERYELSFEVGHNADGLYLVCPYCDQPVILKSCAFGHAAYTILDEDADEKMADAYLERP